MLATSSKNFMLLLRKVIRDPLDMKEVYDEKEEGA